MADEEPPEREAHVKHLLRQAAQTERAPASLRTEVDALRTRASAAPRRRWSRPALGLRYTSLAAAALAVVAAALALTLSGGAGAPTIAQAAALSARGPSAPAPAPDPAAPTALLDVRVGDLQFPNWEHNGGWQSSGERTDRLGNRRVTTVYYSRDGHQLAYSIVSQPVLPGLNTHGEPYARFMQHGRSVIVWAERNHTCVLAAAAMSYRDLWSLAMSVSAKQA